MNGIGYVWIIRVFLLMALIAPLLFQLSRKVEDNYAFLGLIALIYLFYETLNYFFVTTGFFIIDIIVTYFIFYLLSYGCIFALGLRLPSLNNKSINLLIMLFLMIFLGLLLFNYSGSFLPTQLHKYPPRIYYISYATLMSLSLYKLLSTKYIFAFNNSIITFISSSTIWIYLWHILIIFLWNHFMKFLPTWLDNFVLMFLVVLSSALTITYIQKRTFQKVLSWELNPQYKEVISIIFLK
jgi:hypothetical protein